MSKTVAYGYYRQDGPNEYTCARVACQDQMPDLVEPVQLTSEDMPEGGFCSVCGTDVLA